MHQANKAGESGESALIMERVDYLLNNTRQRQGFKSDRVQRTSLGWLQHCT